MISKIVAGGRYFDSSIREFIVIDSIDDESIYFTYESDGDHGSYYLKDMEGLLKNLSAANEVAIAALQNLVVNIKKVHKDAVIPEFKTVGAAGFDLSITEDVTIPALCLENDPWGNPRLVNDIHRIAGTGLAFEVPVGFELEIRSRSGNVFKDIKVFAYNGTIDSDYRGEVKILLTNLGKEDVTFKKGDRVAQGIIKRIEQVSFNETDNLSETERGDKGFNSTGRNS